MKHRIIEFGIKTAIAVLIFFSPGRLVAQEDNWGTVNGNFQSNAQWYFDDDAIGTTSFPEKFGNNTFLYVTYAKGNFRAGTRLESYLPSMQGFLRDRGAGVANLFAEYSTEKFDVTLGSYYDQFGSGMILRAYEEWGLGFDNSLTGARVRFRPVRGMQITGLVGKQRNAFSAALNEDALSDGLVRGFNADWTINEAIPALDSIYPKITIGYSFVSRYQADDDPAFELPENVGASAARIDLDFGNFTLNGEYAYKINDPSTVNLEIYKPGNGLLLNATYSQKGLGISLTAKRIDNMDFRSERAATANNLNLNFLPPQTKQHTFRLPTLFPYATQPNGEIGMQLEVLYSIKKGTALGGKYGTRLTFNFSRLHGLKTTPAADPFMGYESEFFGVSDNIYIQDINFEISKKFSKNFKALFQYLHFTYDKNLFKQLTGFQTSEEVKSHVQVLEMQYSWKGEKMKNKQTVRGELQHAYTQQEFGSWAMALIEWNISRNWFVAAFDEWNYGNANKDRRLHYYSGTVGYIYKDYRLTLGYGRQRAGVLCVGGVCRFVPAANGISLSLQGSF